MYAVGAGIEAVLDNLLKGSGFTYTLTEMHVVIRPVQAVAQNRRRSVARPVAAQSVVTTPVAPSTSTSDVKWIHRGQPVAQPVETPVVVEKPVVVETPVVETPPVVVPPVTPPTVVEVVPPVVEPVQPTTPTVVETVPQTETPAEPVAPAVPVIPAVASETPSPLLAVKTNLLLDATTTMTLGLEVRIAPQWTAELMGMYNPWSWANNRKFKSIVVQPEFRYWIDKPFTGHFIGVHAHWAHYNFGNLPFGQLKNNRYQGDLAGVGFSYGHSWQVAPRWRIEATLGAGYAYLGYQRFDKIECGTFYGDN
jgi:hypothetical protein